MNTPFRSTIQTHIPWLAGVLEGDGCFGISTQHKKQSVYYFPYISVQLTDQKLLEFIAQLLETNISTYKRTQHKNIGKQSIEQASTKKKNWRGYSHSLCPF